MPLRLMTAGVTISRSLLPLFVDELSHFHDPHMYVDSENDHLYLLKQRVLWGIAKATLWYEPRCNGRTPLET